MTGPQPSRYQFGPFALDVARRTVCRNGERVAMTARAFDVLLALVERAGETVDKDELLQIVWPDAVVEESNLTQQVFTIRRLLGPLPDHAAYIVTVPRRGYRFVAPVSRVPASLAPVAAGTVVPPTPPPRSFRLAMLLPADAPLATVAERALTLSPDGRVIVYVAGVGTGTRLYRRELESFDATPIAETEGAANPFFSPDSEWVGFTAGRLLRKVRAAGGPPQTICELDGDVRGATWVAPDRIVFAAGPASPLWQVPANGGTPRPLTMLRFDRGERTHRWPHALPDGGVLFTIGHADASSFDQASLAVADLADPDHRIVLTHATDGRCWGPRTLLCGRQGTLLAAAFDPQRREVTGVPWVLVPGVAMSPTGAVHAAGSEAGVLVHAPGGVQTPGRSLVTLARDGTTMSATVCDDPIEEPRVSPDGRSAIVGRRRCGSDLWLHDRVRQAFRRLTFDGRSFAGIWGPRSGAVTYSSSAGGVADLYWLESDRGVESTPLLQTEFDKVPGAWSPDAATLVYTEYHPDTGADIWVLEHATGVRRPLVRSRFNDYGPSVSPDGRYVAYTGDESGRCEVYVVSLADGSDKVQVSTDGGAEPVWSPDGQEMFYRVGHRMMRVDVSRGPRQAGVPATLFEQRHVPGTVTGLSNYDVVAGEGTFMAVVEQEMPATVTLHVTLETPVPTA